MVTPIVASKGRTRTARLIDKARALAGRGARARGAEVGAAQSSAASGLLAHVGDSNSRRTATSEVRAKSKAPAARTGEEIARVDSRDDSRGMAALR